jgi:hypothetical protein
VVVALSITALFSYVAIACDGGVLLADQQRTQATADAAAMAAASVLYQHYPRQGGLDPDGTAAQAALDEASHNGYTNDGSQSVVTVNIPPASGPYQGSAGYVEVLVTYNQPRFFSSIFGGDVLPVAARSVARGAWVVPYTGILVLDYSGQAALNEQANGAFTDVGAPVIVNSNGSAAAVDTGYGTMLAPEFDITGSYSTSGSGQLVTSPTANNIFTGVHPTPDPFAYLPDPPAPPAGTMTTTVLDNGTVEYSLTPGSYSNLPTFYQGDVVVFQQASAGNGGIYYLSGGGLHSRGATLTLDPSTRGGIMIYNAGTGFADRISISGDPNGSVYLSPLTDGPYTGMMIFQAREATQRVRINGNGTFMMFGTLYAPAALLKVTGTGTSSTIGSQYVTQDLTITGNGNVMLSWQPAQIARTRIITLVE